MGDGEGESAVEAAGFVLHGVDEEAYGADLLFGFVAFESGRDGVDGIEYKICEPGEEAGGECRDA